MNTAPDRITELLAQSSVTGIDFIYIYPDQTTLDIYFLRQVTSLDMPLPGTIAPGDILIYSPGATLPEIEVDSIVTWTTIHDQDVLRLKTKSPGDFTLYRFKIDDPRIDDYFNDISFSFKANCPSDLDCKDPDHECPSEDIVDFPIDYLARDFWSFRKALVDFASLRYPDWADRLEADAGIMLAEALSAMGDEMAYYQDRISREAYLETASQRRSVRRHARLVDYHMHDGLGATGWLDFTVDTGMVDIDAGTNVYSLSDDNSRIDFEVGKGIVERYLGKKYTVTATSNAFEPHLRDEDDTCLPVGSTEMYIKGHHEAHLAFNDFPTNGAPGRWVLLRTSPADPAKPERAQLVRLLKVTNTLDPVFSDNVTHLEWEEAQALQNEFDLTVLTVRGNIVPATAGRSFDAYFIVDDLLENLSAAEINAFGDDPSGETINREGHDDSNIHLFTLPGSQTSALVYLGSQDLEYSLPEIILEEVEFDQVSSKWVTKPFTEPWSYNNSLVGIRSSKPSDTHYTLDDGSWQRVVGYQRIGKEIEHRDYAMTKGMTIRFGDGEFGMIPDKGTVFKVSYRLGGTRRSNVAKDTLTNVSTALAGVSFTNPLPARGGRDPETAEELRQVVSDAFRSLTYRAVRPEDYAEAAERLKWVQKAGAAFRWTGSWLTAFVTPDPLGKVVLEQEQRTDITSQLNRFRQAGREVNVMDPVYANIDLEIEICVAADSYQGQVKESVQTALMGKKGLHPQQGYFSPDRFTFGTLLERTSLEAVIQAVPGVKAVEKILFRRRGWFKKKIFSELSYDPGKNSIIRIANDPLHPEQGTLKLYTHGGI